MTRPRRTAALTALLTCAVAGAARPSEAADLPAVWERFRDRQAAAETARVEFSISQTLSPEEVASLADSEAAGPPPGGPLIIDPHPAVVELSGGRVRFESWGLSFAGGDRGAPVPSVSAFDGGLQQYFSDRSDRPVGPSHGSIRPAAKFDEWENTTLLPLIFALRPLRAEAFGPSYAAWRQEDRPAVVAGTTCLVLSRRPPETPPEFGHVIRAYLDPGRDYLPLRIESEMNRGKTVRLEISYGRDQPPAWVPSEWTSVWLTRRGEASDETRCSLKDVVLGPAIADDRFVIDYPAGTEIIDERPRGRGRMFIVQADGTFLPKRSAQAAASTGQRPWPLILAAAAAAALGAAVLIVWQRRSTAG